MKDTCSVHISLCNQQEKRKPSSCVLKMLEAFAKSGYLEEKEEPGLIRAYNNSVTFIVKLC